MEKELKLFPPQLFLHLATLNMLTDGAIVWKHPSDKQFRSDMVWTYDCEFNGESLFFFNLVSTTR